MANECGTRDASACKAIAHDVSAAEAESRGKGFNGVELGVAGLDGQGVVLLGDGSREFRSPEDVVEVYLCVYACVKKGLVWTTLTW